METPLFLIICLMRSALGLEVVVDLFYESVAIHAVNHASLFDSLAGSKCTTEAMKTGSHKDRCDAFVSHYNISDNCIFSNDHIYILQLIFCITSIHYQNE